MQFSEIVNFRDNEIDVVRKRIIKTQSLSPSFPLSRNFSIYRVL